MTKKRFYSPNPHDRFLEPPAFDVSVHVTIALFRLGFKRGWHLSDEYLAWPTLRHHALETTFVQFISNPFFF